MIYNNRYKIELKGKELPPKSSIENIKGITSVEYNKRDHTVSVTRYFQSLFRTDTRQ
jgi:Cu2+-exporting ATPase